jgi:uncharacterized repeat protein (TIGR03803 family)
MKKTASFYLTMQPLCWRLLHSIAGVMDRAGGVALLAALALPGLTSRAGTSTSPGITAVHTFSALENESAPYINADGASPAAKMTLGKDGNLYGTTTAGGFNGAGNVFVVTTSGKFTNLYNFQGITSSNNPLANDYYDDFLPNELTAGPMNFFFGTTQSGGTNRNGTIFEVTSSGQEVDLYAFSAETTNASGNTTGANPDGMLPNGLVAGTNAIFYGTTQAGGANGTGTIFLVTPSGVFSNVYSFSDASTGANADGATPNGLTLGSDGNFYGTTQTGGANDAGTFFQWTTAGVLTPLYSFGATTNDAAWPQAALVQGPNGNFYGTSAYGGSNSSGTVFEISTNGAETVFYTFSGGNDGGLPNTALVLGTDGNFYGTTSAEGVNNDGTLFKITPAGVFTSLYSFAALNANSENPIGANPSAALAVGRDGCLYGGCLAGGANGTGTIFRYTNAAFVPLYQPPYIATQPPSKTSGLQGLWVTLTAVAKGALPLSCQWTKNKTNVLSDGGDISGSASTALRVGPLQAGDAGSYVLIVTNNYGATNSITVVLTVTPDTTPPGIKIASPAAGARTNAPVFAGTASDDARVTNVLWWLTNLNSSPLLNGTATLTNGGSNWFFAATPFPGTNILAVQSVGSSGLPSKYVQQTFFYKVSNALGLWPGGDGIGAFGGGAASVKNDPIPANGAFLNIGEGYSITAVPVGLSLFSNWVGSSALGAFTNPGATLPFVMQSNMVLTANFATNFFVPARGTYNGLFANPNPNAVAEESSGMLQGLTLGTNGAFSGKLLLGATTFNLGAKFDVSGNFSTNFGSASTPGGKLYVNLTVNRAAREIAGTVSNTLWNANLTAEPAGTNLSSARYTVLLEPPPGAPSNTPPGDGYAQVTNHLGMVTFSGQLADGTSFSPAAAESPNGDVPVYASLYGNTGLLFGWINVTNLAAAAPSNTLTWIKKASRSTAYYTNGFTNTLLLQGGTWTNPPGKMPAIAMPEGQLIISNASLFLVFNVAVSNNDTLVKLPGSPINSLTNSSIAPATGLLTVTFGNGNGKATTSGQGAVLQTQTNGGGFFLGTTNAGLILLLPPQ